MARLLCRSCVAGPGPGAVLKGLFLVNIPDVYGRLVPVRTRKFPVPKFKPTAEQARAGGFIIEQDLYERPMNIKCTGGIFEPYVPPEGDGRQSSVTVEGFKQRTELLKKTATSHVALRKIKRLDPHFGTKIFATKAQEMYVEANNCLANFNKHRLRELVTEMCYAIMVKGCRQKTTRWKFIESLELPRVVHIRYSDMVHKSNVYGQVTVRIHTRQTLAVYDRFGRLMYGGEDVPKDVLEYVVFEKHLTDQYGSWRMHSKIVAPWAKQKDPVIKTMVLSPEEEEELNKVQGVLSTAKT
uniref:Large ribosomal subunit protein mL45 n=1 Tax=Eptatretus burgeri TaxID=7764 RepID=A0A8C4QL70_EPTBU